MLGSAAVRGQRIMARSGHDDVSRMLECPPEIELLRPGRLLLRPGGRDRRRITTFFTSHFFRHLWKDWRQAVLSLFGIFWVLLVLLPL